MQAGDASLRPIPRRSHKKSKLGCKTCKVRKVKVRQLCLIRKAWKAWADRDGSAMSAGRCAGIARGISLIL